jgi:uncharacterized RDD family membrane protein YckC
MTQPQAHNPFAPPQAQVADIGPIDGEQELAGRGARLGAALIDTLLNASVFWAIAAMVSFNPVANASSAAMVFKTGLLGMAIFVLLHGYTLARRGQTLGKLMLGLRIVRSDGSTASLGRLLGLRYGVGVLITLVPYIGKIYALVDSLAIFRESRRCIHDNIADTIVIKK